MNITVVDTLHPLYKDVLKRSATLGYTRPSFRSQLLQSEFVKDLIDNNIWNELDCLYVFAMKSGSAQFATINWKNPTGAVAATLEASGSLTYNDETGINGNGAGGYVDTHFNPVTNGVNYTQNLNSILIAFGTSHGISSAFVDMGNPNTRLRSSIASLQCAYSVNGSEISAVATPTNNQTALWHLTRRASNLVRLYRAGVHTNGTTNSSAALSSNSFYFCAQSNPGFGNPSPCRVALWGAGGQLLGKETIFSTIWNTYLANTIAL